ncbi:MAG: universal stress protein [Novosphingobium sp.]
MKNVLLLIHDDPGQEARLQAALDLTRALSGHLTCIDVTPPPLTADPLWGVASGTIVYDETAREATNLARVEKRLAHEDVAWSIEALRGDYTGCLGDALRSADIVVLNHELIGAPVPDMGMIIGNLLGEHEVLAVAMPAEAHRFAAEAPALIAWDGSAAAMKAVRRAIPLLVRARSVTLLEVGTLSRDVVAAEEAASYLSRHGIKADIQRVPNASSVAAEICRAAGRLGAGYCLMGAYGHSRLREALFGGVTRDMLRPGGPPLVLGH